MIYYIEVNAICIIFLVLLHIQLKQKNRNKTLDQNLIDTMLWSTILLCISDMVAGIFRGMMFSGARIFIEISNAMYFEMIAIVSYVWCIYVFTKFTQNVKIDKKILVISALPIIVFTLVALSNPVTHILFNINSNNIYERNVGVYLHWVIIWTYFLVPFIKSLHMYMKESNVIKKHDIIPLILFMIAPFIASIIQMIFYGVTTTQVGITVSIMLIYLKCQDSQILTDALTGVNNRRALEYFMENQMQHNKDTLYTLIMIDVDRFKQINDRYGHVMGDCVLKKIAMAISEACKVLSNRVHISRFGGDEFVIIVIDDGENAIRDLIENINIEIGKEKDSIQFDLSVSIGYAQGYCTDEKDYNNLINKADQEMYKQKARRIRTSK